MIIFQLFIFNILIVNHSIYAKEFQKCDRVPLDAQGEKTPLDNRFLMSIDGNPEGYIPEGDYTSTLIYMEFLKKYVKLI